jgi:hypothetical protein
LQIGGEGADGQIALCECEFVAAPVAVLDVVCKAGCLVVGKKLQRVEDQVFIVGVRRVAGTG